MNKEHRMSKDDSKANARRAIKSFDQTFTKVWPVKHRQGPTTWAGDKSRRQPSIKLSLELAFFNGDILSFKDNS
jgi:hypothetical protein